MNDVILQKLDEIEAHHNVRILFAIESGSRAWGFASPDSDYDVRFVYAHPEDYYLSIYDHKDVIELPVDAVLDIAGWDIRKALRFIGKTNAVIHEWYQSPIVYRRSTSLMDELPAIAAGYFSPRAAMHHYLSMTINTYEGSLRGETVRLKKYFYALRPILAASWIARYGTVPPMEFDRLRAPLEDTTVQQEIDALLIAKGKADEKSEFAPNVLLNKFIEEQIAAMKQASDGLPKKEEDTAELDRLLRKTIREAYESR